MASYSPVDQVADMFNDRDNLWKPLLMIDARSYFDDSGTHKQSVVTVIAGWVGTLEQWLEIEGPWRSVLNEFEDRNVHCFHATECLSQTGQFERLCGWECHYIYTQLSDILGKSLIQPIIAAVKNFDWESIPNRNPIYGSAYDYCVDRIIGQVVNWASNNAKGTKIPVVIAMQKEHREETQRTFDSWANVDIIRDRIDKIEHAYPDRYVPLQAADLLAHEFWRKETLLHAIDNRGDIPADKLHPPCFQKITKGRRLRDGGLYSRWFLEQTAIGIQGTESA